MAVIIMDTSITERINRNVYICIKCYLYLVPLFHCFHLNWFDLDTFVMNGVLFLLPLHERRQKFCLVTIKM